MSDSFVPLFEGFATPAMAHDDAFDAELAVTHARATIQRFVRLRHHDLRSVAPSMADTLMAAITEPLLFDDVWQLPIGMAWANLRSDPQYQVTEVAPLIAAWADQRCMHDDQAGHAHAAANQPVITCGGRQLTLRYREDLRFGFERPLRDQALPRAAHGRTTRTLHEAFDFLREYAPEFVPWTLRLLREVVPVTTTSPGNLCSGSSAAEPGRCHMSIRNGPVPLAEMLVHETTHQYYYLVTRMGPVDDGSDTELYFSPAKQRGRPIHYILIAYHAFANVLLFSKRCLDNGFDDPDGYLHRNVVALSEWMRHFESALRTTKALTPLGLALWRPLARQLEQAGIVASPASSMEHRGHVAH